MNRRVLMAGAASAPVLATLATASAAQAAPVVERQPAARSGGSYKVAVPAGPLWSNDQAQKVGPWVAAAHFGRFTGQWWTVVNGSMSVVEVELPVYQDGTEEYTMDVPAGALWSNDDAKAKCPHICASYGGTWTGQWRTVVWGKLSVAECVFRV
ncbi:mannan-binding protein [Catenuloplanes sp. NPDC051500]|uniref:mannan-binding protein n=1 Tax=Catenuloplanes sp. NPDC051500 TaxID=3363959 RepID=UPI0037A4B2F2